MIWLTSRDSRRPRFLALVTLIAFSCVLMVPIGAASQTSDADKDRAAYDKFEEVKKLKFNAEYDDAIAKLHEIIKAYSNSNEVLQRAYHELVAIYDTTGDRANAEATARQALERYPGLTADPNYFPSTVNDRYDRLRKEMFGSLTIEKPEGCRVFLDGDHVGTTPLRLPLVGVGEHMLTLTKSGHHDYTDRVLIQPGVSQTQNVSLQRKRGRWWWITRGGGVVVAAVALVIGLSGDDPVTPPPDDPLPEPPAPPTN